MLPSSFTYTSVLRLLFSTFDRLVIDLERIHWKSTCLDLASSFSQLEWMNGLEVGVERSGEVAVGRCTVEAFEVASEEASEEASEKAWAR